MDSPIDRRMMYINKKVLEKQTENMELYKKT
jgi:hypothetical protein